MTWMCERRSLALLHYLQSLKTLTRRTLNRLTDECPQESLPQALDWHQVRALEASGLVRFGPHGASHAILTGLDDHAPERRTEPQPRCPATTAATGRCRSIATPMATTMRACAQQVANHDFPFALGTGTGIYRGERRPAEPAALRRQPAHRAQSGVAVVAHLSRGARMSRSNYLKHLALSMGTKLAMIALRLLRNVLLARILGPSERGLFALLSTLPDLISAATSGGLNSAVGYQAAKQRPMGLLLSQVLVFGCLLAALLTLLVVALVREFGS